VHGYSGLFGNSVIIYYANFTMSLRILLGPSYHRTSATCYTFVTHTTPPGCIPPCPCLLGLVVLLCNGIHSLDPYEFYPRLNSMFCNKDSPTQSRVLPCTPLTGAAVPCLSSHPLFEGPQVLTLHPPSAASDSTRLSPTLGSWEGGTIGRGDAATLGM